MRTLKRSMDHEPETAAAADILLPPPPPLVLELVCTRLSPRSILCLMGVCREWRRVCGSDRVWARVRDAVFLAFDSDTPFIKRFRTHTCLISALFTEFFWNTKTMLRDAYAGVSNYLFFMALREYLVATTAVFEIIGKHVALVDFDELKYQRKTGWWCWSYKTLEGELIWHHEYSDAISIVWWPEDPSVVFRTTWQKSYRGFCAPYLARMQFY